MKTSGGEGIRTPGTLAGSTDFKGAAGEGFDMVSSTSEADQRYFGAQTRPKDRYQGQLADRDGDELTDNVPLWRERGESLGEAPFHQGRRVLRRERMRRVQRVGKHHTERIDIGPSIDVLVALQLLVRRVQGRAHVAPVWVLAACVRIRPGLSPGKPYTHTCTAPASITFCQAGLSCCVRH
jgi:hypothetical protein